MWHFKYIVYYNATMFYITQAWGQVSPSINFLFQLKILLT